LSTFPISVPGPAQHRSFFYLSNLRLPELLTLTDHLVGFVELAGTKWPIFIDRGFLCLKLNQLESLVGTVPVWIDSQYRIRLGKWSTDAKAQPVLHFTTMAITLPSAFEYSSVCEVSTQANPTNNNVALPNDNSASNKSMAPWDDAAGMSFVPRASNSLSPFGQIPHSFPVMEDKPNIAIDPWLPPAIRQIVKEAKKHQRTVIVRMNAAAISSKANRSTTNSLKSNSKSQ